MCCCEGVACVLPMICVQLCKCPADKLAHNLTHRTLEAKADVVCTELLVEQAYYGRDALAKAIYERVFLWLVRRINSSLEEKVLYLTTSFVH